MKTTRKIIRIDEDLCDGCGQCVPSCAEGAIQVINGKAKLVADKYCDGLGACLGECPQGALIIIEREADEFDEDAVEAHLKATEQALPDMQSTQACGCPSSLIQSFEAPLPGKKSEDIGKMADNVSELRHWPVQIRLVPPGAPFLKNANLLITADCTAVAYPGFHRDFLRGKVIMMGCPKFDSQDDYIQKFADIFGTADIKDITVLVMDVPCCQGLPLIVERGLQIAGKQIPVEKVVISSRGEVLDRQKMAA
jgi:NAD-dependent dihydropyrimidine dehydrogenase PreA subunit